MQLSNTTICQYCINMHVHYPTELLQVLKHALN